MHIVIGAIGLLTAVYIFVIRARNAAEMTQELMGMADEVRAVARRLGFRRTGAVHPVEAIDDPNTAAATIATAYLELHGLPTEETRATLVRAMQSALEIDLKEADEQLILGRWLVNECNGPVPAIARAARRLSKLTSGEIGPLLDILASITADPISDRQADAMQEIKRAFRHA
jgi:hypothetical protein